jgi:hypothetical protein
MQKLNRVYNPKAEVEWYRLSINVYIESDQEEVIKW